MPEHFYQDSDGHLRFHSYRLDHALTANSSTAGGQTDIPTLKLGQDADPDDRTAYSSNLNLVNIYKDNLNSVIRVNGSKSTSEGDMLVSGSGVFLTGDGVAVTDLHVVQDASDLKVTTADGQTHDARVLKLDPATDTALLCVQPLYRGETFQVPKIGHSSDLPAGSKLISMGHPGGWLQTFVSEGTLTRHSTMGKESEDIEGGLQPGEDPNRQVLRARIHLEPGCSGEPVFDSSGNLVSIVDTAAPDRSESTPIEDVLRVLNRTRSTGNNDSISSTLSLQLTPRFQRGLLGQHRIQ